MHVAVRPQMEIQGTEILSSARDNEQQTEIQQNEIVLLRSAQQIFATSWPRLNMNSEKENCGIGYSTVSCIANSQSRWLTGRCSHPSTGSIFRDEIHYGKNFYTPAWSMSWKSILRYQAIMWRTNLIQTVNGAVQGHRLYSRRSLWIENCRSIWRHWSTHVIDVI